nr:transcription antitermination factor NusB [bacterium]
MSGKSFSRSATREAAMCMLFAWSLGGQEEGALLEELEGKADFEAAARYVARIVEKLDDIDAAISRQAKGWRLGRLARVDLSVLRLAVYEMVYEDLPAAVAINEAVELAKRYGGDESPVFINGVLSAYNRAREAGEA